jgi:hypothetical protein
LLTPSGAQQLIPQQQQQGQPGQQQQQTTSLSCAATLAHAAVLLCACCLWHSSSITSEWLGSAAAHQLSLPSITTTWLLDIAATGSFVLLMSV